jgi:hypothetical protein
MATSDAERVLPVVSEQPRPVLDPFRAKEVVAAVDATGLPAQVQASIREHLGMEVTPA